MSRYQQAPYSDSPGPGGYQDGTHGNNYGGNNYGGYSDEPGYSSGGYNHNAGAESYPMGPTNPYAATSPGGYQPKKKRNKWLWIGIPVLVIIIIIAAVLGGVLGTRKHNDSSDSSSSSSGSTSSNGNSAPSGVSVNPSSTSTGANGEAYLAIATNSQWMLPVYATGTNTAGYAQPTFSSTTDSKEAWPSDPSAPSNDSIRSHPRLIAPAYKWTALQTLIPNNPYLKAWNDTIIANATSQMSEDPEQYTEDGGLSGSGVLDVARRIKMKVKNWSYAYRMTNNTAFADRVWLELQTAAGNNSDVSFGADDDTRWNPAHFLDVAEFCNAFAIGYDWLYDHWTDDQRNAIMWSLLNLGLQLGYNALTLDSSASAYSWWTGSPSQINGNWNCVCNGGLTMAALAIADADPTGLAAKVLALTVPSAYNNCFQGAHADGTWAETANYWYFGTCAAAEMSSALLSAYGDDRGLAQSNPGYNLTSLYHIYAQGKTSLFNYGDVGPNKYSTTANGLIYWASAFSQPRYALYQRDQHDAAEPYAMFWYDPTTTGTWWADLPIDHHFDSSTDDWATARSDWPDLDGSYWAMKSGALTGHQTHGDLDLGDFVVDALGERWFGELGSQQYLSDGYFSTEAQNSERWLYYRKRTDGQNTLYINYQNQNVDAAPSTNFGSSGTAQGLAPSLSLQTDDTAFFTTDLTSAYNYTVKRGIRFLNGRKQVLVQDDITGIPSGTDVMWRAHTNASVSIDSNGTLATLTLNSKTATVSLLAGPASATFTTMAASRLSQDPPAPTGSDEDSETGPYVTNDGVTVLAVDSTVGGDMSFQVLINPQWDGMSASSYVVPSSVSIDSWSLTSHN